MTDSSVIVVGPVVILTGPALRTALGAFSIAAKARRVNGLPASTTLTALAQALADAMAANGQSDVPETAVAQHVPQQLPTVTIEDAADRLQLSQRQIRRLAPKLGGRIVAGRWLLDEDSVREHLNGRN